MNIIKEISEGFCLAEAEIDELHEQEKNANIVPREAFNRLKENIKKEGHLESIPLCVMTDGKIYIISGHHRVRAARSAGQKNIIILLYTKHLTRSQIRAKQLAHNAIHGTDDLQTLSEMVLDIETVEDKIESYIDFDALKTLDIPIKKLENITGESRIDPIHISMVFLPKRLELLDEALLAYCDKEKKQDALYVCSDQDWERFKWQ